MQTIVDSTIFADLRVKNSIMRIVSAALFTLVVALVAGCGGGPDLGTPVTVTGVIQQGGKPLSDATVTFHALADLPAAERTRTAKTDAQGAYTLEKVYPTEYKVMIQKFGAAAADPGMAPADGGASSTPLALYGDESNLRAKVNADQKTFPFSLP